MYDFLLIIILVYDQKKYLLNFYQVSLITFQITICYALIDYETRKLKFVIQTEIHELVKFRYLLGF